jgi:hypothetical protein
VCVNLIGRWNKSFSAPLWVMTSLEPEQGLRIYTKRMKIDETNRDLKSLLGMTKLMNKQQCPMEKMLALLLLVYAIGLLIGEVLRDHLYSELIHDQAEVSDEGRIPGSMFRKKGKKWKRYSGLFILLKQKWSLSISKWQEIVTFALSAFLAMVQHPVPTYV